MSGSITAVVKEEHFEEVVEINEEYEDELMQEVALLLSDAENLKTFVEKVFNERNAVIEENIALKKNASQRDKAIFGHEKKEIDTADATIEFYASGSGTVEAEKYALNIRSNRGLDGLPVEVAQAIKTLIAPFVQ